MAAAELQDALRFLSQDAKVPLATAMGKVKELQKTSLMTPEAIAKTDLKTIQSIFNDEKVSKQIHNAAKRVSKKRTAPAGEAIASPSKRSKKGTGFSKEPLSPAELEESLALPTSEKSLEELEAIELFTNRAPLVLAFCVTLLKYTMPNQPLTSRLSLAQAYVSVSSRSRAVDLGIEKGASAQEEGWGTGQPTVKIMGKDIPVMRRTGHENNSWGTAEQDMPSQDTISSQTGDEAEQEPALWGMDLEALKSSNLANARAGNKSNSMPIYTPQSARSYLLKAAGSAPGDDGAKTDKKQTTASKAAITEDNLGMLLKSIELVYESWISSAGPAGLDSRTWGWYARVRPEIASGKAGWGAKNVVKLKDIIALRKHTVV